MAQVTREQVARKIEERIQQSARQLEALEKSYKPQLDHFEAEQTKMLKLLKKVREEILATEQTQKDLEAQIPTLNKEYMGWASKFAGSEQILVGLRALEDRANRVLDMYQRQLGQIHNILAEQRKRADPQRIRARMMDTWRIRQYQGVAYDINQVFRPGDERELFDIKGPA